MDELIAILRELKKLKKEHKDNYRADLKKAQDIFEERRVFIREKITPTSTEVNSLASKLLKLSREGDTEQFLAIAVKRNETIARLNEYTMKCDELMVAGQAAAKVYEDRSALIKSLEENVLKWIDENDF